jgi:hypothetical protein
MKLKEKINDTFRFDIEAISERPDKLMQDSHRHFKITVTNRTSKKKASFYFSIGIACGESDEELSMGLISSIFLDRTYEDIEEFKGLGYDFDEGLRIFEAIQSQQLKSIKIGLEDFFNNLNEEELQEIDEGL